MVSIPVMPIDTPCIAVCFMDPTTDLCAGCGRTMREIASWHGLDRDERLAVMTELPQRILNAGMTPIVRKTRQR